MSATRLWIAGLVSAAGMLLAVVANFAAVGCNAYLSSDVLDCVPWGRVIDVGHAVAALATGAVCVGLVETPSVTLIEKRVARIGLAVTAVIGVLHLPSVTGLRSHTDLFLPLVALRAAEGIRGGPHRVPREPV